VNKEGDPMPFKIQVLVLSLWEEGIKNLSRNAKNMGHQN
jgi:hypothetical protein